VEESFKLIEIKNRRLFM